VDLAVRSLKLAAEHQAALVLCGEGDLVPIAWALHRRTLGADKPFILCDPRRGTRASARSPTSHASGVAACKAAVGGSLCVRAQRLPQDSVALAGWLRASDDVMFIVCTEHDFTIPLPVRPASINVLSLACRGMDLNRIVAEYAADAIAALGVPASSFTAADRSWVRRHAATSFDEIEKATMRLVAIRTLPNLSQAAARLGMTPMSLKRWAGRRKLPPPPAQPLPARWEVTRPEAPTLAEIWRTRVLDMLEEPQREGLAPEFTFEDANIRDEAKRCLARIKSGPVPWDDKAIAGLEALLADLEASMGPAVPGADKPKR
jgi:DNA-binding transcriptional regulator YiaG